MTSRPVAVLAMAAARTRHVFSKAATDQLHELCTIPDPAPLERFDTPHAAALLAQAEILVTGWGCPPIDGAVLARIPRLRLVAHSAGTVRGIVGAEVFAAGIPVLHAADANAVPVAEYTLAAILSANKRVARFRALCRAGDHAAIKALGDAPIGNLDRTVGIIGASRIGRRIMAMLAPFDLRVLLHDPTLAPAEATALGVRAVRLDTLMQEADIVSVHAPALQSTRHMIDARALALMRDGATLINTARGSLVDQAALEAELVSGRIDAVLDVTEPEVLPVGSPLLHLPNCIVTPHIAGALGRERERLGALVVAEIARFVSGDALRHAIRPEAMASIA